MSSTTTHPTVAPSPRPPQRRRRGLRIITILLGMAVLGVTAAIAYLLWTDSKIERIPDAQLPALATPIEGPRTFLVVGSDSRENLPDDLDQGNFGTAGGRRTDVIMLVKFVPGEGAQLLSIPRDLKVEIPERGTNKINAAFAFGGPDLLIRTLKDNLDIDINHYIEVDFGGFAAIVDSLGGVTIDFAYAARDSKSGLDVDAGTQTLDGAQALAYARSRQYQELRDGGWESVGATDIGRTQRQQGLLLALFDQVSTSSAFDLPGFAGTVAENITTDAGLDLGALIDLGRSALQLSSSDLEGRTLPVRITNEGGVSYVVPVEPEAKATLDAFLNGEPFPSL
ncbi:MAG: LCP family protein [Acidimicrobiia bacterium]|nr:LCP family protein [Acidimicrobiia bacterium]